MIQMMAASAALALALGLLLPSAGVRGAGPPPIQDGEFTFLLPAGRKQCFYQSAPANASLETEYQVEGPGPESERSQGERAWPSSHCKAGLKEERGGRLCVRAWGRDLTKGAGAAPGSRRGGSKGRRRGWRTTAWRRAVGKNSALQRVGPPWA